MLEFFIFAFLQMASGQKMHLNPVSLQHSLSLIQPSAIPVKKNASHSPALLGEDSLSVWAQDLKSGKMLFSKEASRAQPIASLTKLMVFWIIYQHYSLEDIVTVSPEATITEGAQIDLYGDEKLKIKTLLEAILIPSANDAARALAIHHSGSEEAFVELMNKTAREMGFKTAHFVNSTGLDVMDPGTEAVSGNEMSAQDLAFLTKKLLAIPFFRETVQQPEFYGTSIDENFAHERPSTNKLLGSFLGSKGVKTGYTPLAGECLIHLSEKEDGTEILSVVLGSPDRFQETKNLITWIWDNFVWR